MRLIDAIKPSGTGASTFGVHFLADALSCQYKWALKYLMPTGDGRGIQPPVRVGGPLDTGLAFHQFAETWYRSRCRTGEDNGQPDLDEALAAADKLLMESGAEWGDPEDFDKARSDVRDWGVRYHRHYGPGGPAAEFPHTRVYCDDSGPWVERELVVPLGPTGLYFTCRIDLVATHMDALGAWDHKTTTPQGYWRLFTGMDLAPQPTGNLLALAKALPDLPIGFWVINAINKNPAKVMKETSVPPFGRERTHRTTNDLHYFEYMVRTVLEQLDEKVDEWGQQVAAGGDPLTSIISVFGRTGQFTQHCYAYQRPCEYTSMCTAVGYEGAMLDQFTTRVRTVADEEPNQ